LNTKNEELSKKLNQAESEKAELNQEKANLVNVFNLKKKFINLNLF
jgi:hypothetical protein